MGGPDHKVKGIRIDTVREYPFQMGLQPGFNADADGECALKAFFGFQHFGKICRNVQLETIWGNAVVKVKMVCKADAA